MIRKRKKIAVCTSIICITIIFGILLLKKTQVFYEIKKGDFSSINKIEERERNALETIYHNQMQEGDMEWVLFDLNLDGQKELIWRKKDSPYKDMQRIVAIFGREQGEYRLIMLDTTDNTEYYALKNGHLIYYWQYFWLYDYASFKKCIINEAFEIEVSKELEVFMIPSYDFLLEETDEEWVSSLIMQYPFINGEGNYFRIITYEDDNKTEKIVTEEDWLQELKFITGSSLEQVNIELYEMLVNKNDNHKEDVAKTNDVKISESEASPNSDELETVNKNDKHEEVVVNINDVKITESETNPYSRETTVGFYLNDIFEANRGSYTSKDLSQEDSFEYYEIFNPLQDDHYCMEWEINLLKLQGSDSIISEFNNYHESLFKKEKEEMVKLYEEGRTQFEEGMQPNFNYYSRNLRTESYYSWGSFFTVVDVANVHMSKKGGCSVITANFNRISGKKYEMGDLFMIQDYKNWLLMKIEARYQEEGYMVMDWNYCLNKDEISFLLTFKGFMLIDNFEQRTFLLEWDELEDVLCQDIVRDLKNI